MVLLHLTCKSTDGSNKATVTIPHALHAQNIIYKKSIVSLSGTPFFGGGNVIYAHVLKGATNIFSNQEVINSDDYNAALPVACGGLQLSYGYHESDYHIAYHTGTIPQTFDISFVSETGAPVLFEDQTTDPVTTLNRIKCVDLFFEISDITYSVPE